MSDREANIDLVFRNGLKEFEALPPNDIWENIIPVVRRKQKSAFLVNAAAIATILISLGFCSFWITRQVSGYFNGPALSLNQDVMPEGTYVEKAKPIIINDNNSGNFPVELQEFTTENTDIPTGGNYLTIPFISLNISPEAGNSLLISKRSDLTLNNSFSNSNTTIKENTDISLQESFLPVKYDDKWSVAAMATPTYYSRFTSIQDDVAKDLISSEKPAVSYTGGLSFLYKINKRISIQTGLYYSSFGQEVNGISSYAGFHNYFDAKGGSDFGIQTSTGTIISTNSDLYIMDNQGSRVLTKYTVNVFDPVKADLTYLDNSIMQNFNYLEFPLLVRYKLIDKKIDFNVIGGLSYNLLISNSAFSYNNSVKYYIGKTNGLSPVTFSSSLGMGMEYNFSEKISFNLEPTFRYYLTPFGGLVGSAIHPYSFGILSGLSYKF